MNNLTDISTASRINEQSAAEAFSRQASVFDELYAGDTIIQYKRKRVRAHVEQYLPAAAHILELNAGTGDDALYFASKGHHVHATDIAAGMQDRLKEKVDQAKMNDRVTTEICSFTDLAQLQNRGPYDLVFSNFAGLNCTDRLDAVLHELAPLLPSGGLITLVVLPKFCLWETLLIFKGKFKTATRRLFSGKGVLSHVEGAYFKCWYYSPRYIVRRLKKNFDLESIEGLCTLVPPSYMEQFAEKHPHAYAYLVDKENKWKRRWPWRVIGDYYIITMRKK